MKRLFPALEGASIDYRWNGKVGFSLETLEAEVQALRAAEADKERQARVEQLRLHANAVRQLMRFMKPPGGAPAHPALAEQDQP